MTGMRSCTGASRELAAVVTIAKLRTRSAIREPDRIGLALLAELLPFVKAIEWNEAAPPGKGFAEGRPRVDALGLGVDVGEADLDVLRTERHQAPAHDIEAALPGPSIVADNGQILGRRGVPVGRYVRG